ncbi:MAG: ABC transporter substrate-binding protein [Alphaproteobacteria bacterium]|nr:ABC transporter substrate-binding protein [Alphaproteobacteria bacterium]
MTTRRTLLLTTAAAAALAVAAPALAQKVQGVTDKEIVIGKHTDLSGPAAIWGVAVTNGMRMRVEEVNAAGGIFGRKIRFIVEDNAYTQPKAVQATDKLLKRDRVFAMVGNLGTPMNMVSMPESDKLGVPNLFPFSAAALMYEPHHKLHFSFTTTYDQQMRAATKYFVENRGKKRVAILYQDDDYGIDVLNGAEWTLKAKSMELVSKTTYKRGATDFSSQVALMRQANADLVVLGTIIRETIGAAGEAKKIGWNIDMVGPSAMYTPQVAELAPQGVTEGMFGVGQTPILYPDTAGPEAKVWMDKYKAKFNRDADLQAMAGYAVMDLFVTAADKAGKNLSVDSLVKGIESIKNHGDIFGSAPMNFAANKRQGPDPQNSSVLYQIKNKRWIKVDKISY